MKIIALAAVVLLLPQESDPWFPWHGFGVGSRTVVRKTDVGGAEAPSKMYRRTVTAIENGWPNVEIEMKENEKDEWGKLGAERVPYAGKTAAAQSYAEKELPKGEVVIDGKKVAVTVTEWTAPKGGLTLTITRAAGLSLPLRDAPGPGGNVTLPADCVGWKLGSKEMTLELKVVSTDQKRKIGEREVACILEEGTMTQTLGEGVIKGKTKVWWSSAVPGRRVRSETENDIMGQVSGSIEEVVEFEVKPAK